MESIVTVNRNDYQSEFVQPWHEHDHWQISMILSGSVSESIGTAERISFPLNVGVKAPGVRHRDRYGGYGATILQLTFPIGHAVETLVDRVDRVPQWGWSQSVVVSRAFLRIVNHHPAPCPVDSYLIADFLALLVAPPDLGSPPAVTAGGAKSPPNWLRLVMEEITAATWIGELRVSELARRAGVHPVYLARAVRRWYGTSVGSVIRNRRLLDAANLLSRDREATISQIAHRSGYSDEAHFCRSFGASTGITPGRFRRLMAFGPSKH